MAVIPGTASGLYPTEISERSHSVSGPPENQKTGFFPVNP